MVLIASATLRLLDDVVWCSGSGGERFNYFALCIEWTVFPTSDEMHLAIFFLEDLPK